LFASIQVGVLSAGESIEIYPSAPNRGEFVIVRVRGCASDARYDIRVGRGNVVPVSETLATGSVAYLGIPLTSASTTRLELRRNGTPVQRKDLFLPPLEQAPPRPITVASAYVRPPDALSVRLDQEADLLKETRKRWTNIRWFGNIPVPPVENGRVGTRFGAKRIFNDQKESVHWGVDIAGAPALVCSLFPGKVILVRELYFSGLTVFVEHGLGLMTQYSHLADACVKEGDFVPGGAVLGRMGMTGRATGPHLHLSAYINGTAVDPLTVSSNCRRFKFQ
jgi:murein DD-endopeptidase MepM/ murein hydrolase activator NlpD